MQNALNSGGLFLVGTLFDLYIFVLLIRVILMWSRTNYFNPMSQIIVKLTNPIITPLRKIIPVYAGIEWASVLVMFVLEMLKFFLMGIIVYGMPNVGGLVVLAFADLLKLTINVFFYAIIIQAVLSWVQPSSSPMSYLLSQITSPVMRPIQRIVPPVGGFDISPIPAMIVLQLLIVVAITPLMSYGTMLAFH